MLADVSRFFTETRPRTPRGRYARASCMGPFNSNLEIIRFTAVQVLFELKLFFFFF
jgi:hypothetical protein